MIRFICPECDKHLTVSDEKAGKIATCPACKTRIIIPEAETRPQADSVTAEPPRRRPIDDDDDRPVRRRRDDYDDENDPPRRRRSEVDDDDDFDRPRRRKRRRKRRRSEGFLDNMPLGLDAFALILLGLVFMCLMLLGLSLLLPPLALLPMGIGFLMVAAGRVWFLVIVFQEDTTQGMLCLLIPIYGLIYLLQNFDEVKKPFFLDVGGIVIIVLSACAGGAGAH